MLYPVLKNFKDKQDNKREYRSNDWYPRFGFETTDERVDELFELGHIGKQVEEVKQDFPKHIGGGWYELSNGERVQGKEEAEEAENEVGD